MTQQHLDRFYQIMTALEALPLQGRELAAYTGRSQWPERGVYFFREPGELRLDGSRSRIVRVGTHAVSANARSRLWGRLRAHRGGRDGGGNHRGSIFRLHVGTALLERPGSRESVPTWSIGQSAARDIRNAEKPHEMAVSEYIGRMSVLWVDVPDAPGPGSARVRIERGAIGLLSNGLKPIDPPSAGWLGNYSTRREIRESGLWNLNHVTESCDLAFLDELEDHLVAMQRV